ncbi:MAG: rod shape-determining protein MreD [Rhodospirillales bacterium]|nr:rod shape-determining protein MreD [Rhodospirillales bacterium]
MSGSDRRPGIRPRPTLGRRLDIAARRAFPVTCTILLMVLVELPFGFAAQTALLPALTFGCVWFWSVYRPTAMPPPLVFLIGLLLDLMGYLPLGVSVLTLLCMHGAAVRWRRFLVQQGFAMTWLAFVPVAVAGSALSWGLTALLGFRLIPAGPAAFEATLAAALYPALAIPLARAHRSIADPERA